MKRYKKDTKRIFLSPPHMGGEELYYVQEAFANNYIAPLGPQVDAFEREFSQKIGIKHAVALSSGTAAIHLALRVLGIGSGDEVIASALTFIGGVTPIIYQGAQPVFVDSDFESWTMDVDLLSEEFKACEKQGRFPKAVVPTDLYGQCADLDKILDICKPYGIPVIVDAAEALGSLYKESSARPGAKASIFSFNGNKIITTSGGGILASDDLQVIDYARKLSQQAREPFPHYEHKEIGYNYRMSNVLAGIGRGQLRVLDDRVRRKRQIFEKYRKAFNDLAGIEMMPEKSYVKSNRWLSVIFVSPGESGTDREKIRLALDAQKIEARPVWKPMHLQPVFSECRCLRGRVSEDLFSNGLCLPSGTAMEDDEIERVISIIYDCV